MCKAALDLRRIGCYPTDSTNNDFRRHNHPPTLLHHVRLFHHYGSQRIAIIGNWLARSTWFRVGHVLRSASSYNNKMSVTITVSKNRRPKIMKAIPLQQLVVSCSCRLSCSVILPLQFLSTPSVFDTAIASLHSCFLPTTKRFFPVSQNRSSLVRAATPWGNPNHSWR